ncbi:uncharacterized protein LOC9643787 [Selaginella moellendorffii]|nr:uncharacterized protein LOC9643787 [Selaginella moellendorffii]|eukprot:XP_002963194.2 uncharacterized protein LOC9643787 [Selaginella moellendorffii]
MCKADRTEERRREKEMPQQQQQQDRAVVIRHSSSEQRLSLQEQFDKLEVSSTCSSSSSSSYGSSITTNSVSSGKIKVTLLYRKADNFILYMEAGKDFVDLLLSFLTLPIGTAMKLLRDSAGSKPSGGIANIYDSLLDLDESLFYVDKEPLVSPKPLESPELSIDLLKPSFAAGIEGGGGGGGGTTPKRSIVYYKCCNHGCLRFVIDLPGQICPVCKFAMSHKLELIQPKASYPPSPVATPTTPVAAGTPRRKDKVGYVRKNRTFIITDSLEILPLSSITGVILLSKLKLDSLKDLQSCQVCVGVPEVLELLRASLSSQTALNDVFGSKKK